MKASRPWLAVVLALFSLPLFVGLGRRDIRGDEAGHTFSVERILEIGDWLAPKSSPSETDVFLEKPPLKFWIVAAPIKLGILPHDEFGFRFWDALFGGIAFLYVFAIGGRLMGPVCGAVAVLILFVHGPLLFEHGLRGNNMEAALLLCYCGGVYHYMAAMASPDARRRWRHAAAVGVYFVLGFMVKDVAALFMPATLFLASLLFRDWRVKLARDWRAWAGASVLAVALIAPWFLYTWHRFGNELWTTMFGAHVYKRMTSFLDPTHLHPWNFYFTQMYANFRESASLALVGAGSIVLLVQTIRRRWAEGGAVLLWFAFPILTISIGTSKLYHYAYPFLPGAALAGGYLAGLIYALAPAPLERALRFLRAHGARGFPRFAAACARPPAQAVLLTLALLAGLVAGATLVHGPVRLAVGHTDLLKSSGVVRPIVLLLVAGLLAGVIRGTTRAAVAIAVAGLLPLMPYFATLAQLDTGDHPMRDARDCVMRVNEQPAVKALGPPRGLWVDGLYDGFSHEHYLYFRKIQPWTVAPTPSPDKLAEFLDHPAEQRPSLVLDTTYQAFMHSSASPVHAGRALPPMVSFGDVVLLLPGPYAACSSEAAAAARSN